MGRNRGVLPYLRREPPRLERGPPKKSEGALTPAPSPRDLAGRGGCRGQIVPEVYATFSR